MSSATLARLLLLLVSLCLAAGRSDGRLARRQLVSWLLDDPRTDDGEGARRRQARGSPGEGWRDAWRPSTPEKKWFESGDEEVVYTVHRQRKRSLVQVSRVEGDLARYGRVLEEPQLGIMVRRRGQSSDNESLGRHLLRESGPGGKDSPKNLKDFFQTPSYDAKGRGSSPDPLEQNIRRRRRHNAISLRSLDSLAEAFAEEFEPSGEDDDDADGYTPEEKSSIAARKKLKKKGLKKYLLPLLLAYKLKFFALIPLMLGGLVLMVGSTGMAGFFFALFAAVMTLRAGHHVF